MAVPPFIQQQSDSILLSIKLQPRASKNQIAKALGEELRIKVTAPPVDSAANEALVRFLAETIGLPRGSVQLVRGLTSRHKTVKLTGITASELMEKLK